MKTILYTIMPCYSVGIIGEYIGKIYLETKERPKYIIEEFLHK